MNGTVVALHREAIDRDTMALSEILRARQEERKKGLHSKQHADHYRAKFKREEMLKVSVSVSVVSVSE